MDYVTTINQSGVITTINDTNYSVELGFIAMCLVLGLLIYYKMNKLLGLIVTLVMGVLTLYYGSTNSTGLIFGIAGWVIIGVGILLFINYAFEPIKIKKNR